MSNQTSCSQTAVLVSAMPLALQGLREYLAGLSCLAIVATASTIEEALQCLTIHRPYFLFLQPDRFEDAGLGLCNSIRRYFPHTRILIITYRTEVDLVLAYARLGVVAYFLEDDLPHLIQDIEKIAAGVTVLGRHLVQDITDLFNTPLGSPLLDALRSQLTSAQFTGIARSPAATESRRDSILRLVWEGLSNKEIAKILGISESTVAEHLKRERNRVGPLNRVALSRQWAESKRH